MNQVALIGEVIRAWMRDGRTMVRLAVRRSEYHPPKREGVYDYVTVDLQRVVPQAQLVGKTLEVVGMLVSVRREVSLEALLDADAKRVLREHLGRKVVRVSTEVLALSYAVLPGGSSAAPNGRVERRADERRPADA